MCADAKTLYQSDGALQSAFFLWALQTRTNLAGKMSFKKKFILIEYSRSVCYPGVLIARVVMIATVMRKAKLENLDAALCYEEGTDRIAQRCLN